jgi:hypothetical protein
VLAGAPSVIHPGVPLMTPSSRGPVLLQPIVEPVAFAARPWTGRKLRLYGAKGAVCDGAIDHVAIAVEGKMPPKGATPTAAEVTAAWADQRDQDRALVGVLRAGTSCADALWAQDVTAPAPTYGTLEPKRLRTTLHTRYFEAEGGGYEDLSVHYQLNDLDAEYSDPAANEAKIPVAERLTPKLVDKTWRSYAACDAGGRCAAVAIGAYRIDEVTRGYMITGKTVVSEEHLAGSTIGGPLAAADVDGDGTIDLIYETRDGIGVFGKAVNANAELYAPNWGTAQ